MKPANHRAEWDTQDIKSATKGFIDHVYDSYYEEYKNDSERFEKVNNALFLAITILNFSVTVLIGIKEILPPDCVNANVELLFTMSTFLIPSVSSFLLLYYTQKGFKKKEEIRELARIQAKFLVNEAKTRFATAKTDADFETLYKWLNGEIRQLQEKQAGNYFMVHNHYEKQ
jgi:hypothetical protein